MLDLLEIRKQIDAIDSKMVKLFEQRMQLCSDVAEYKIENGKEVLDRKREEEKLEKLEHMTSTQIGRASCRERV